MYFIFLGFYKPGEYDFDCRYFFFYIILSLITVRFPKFSIHQKLHLLFTFGEIKKTQNFRLSNNANTILSLTCTKSKRAVDKRIVFSIFIEEQWLFFSP